MFQDMSKKLTESMGPFRALVEIQSRMLEALAHQQMECTKSCFEATLQQTREMQKCQTPSDLLELQQHYAKDLEDTLRSTGESNIKALNQAKEQMEQLAQDAFNPFATKK